MLQTEYRPKEQELLEHARDTTWSDIHAMQRGWICTRNNMVWRARNRVCTRSNAPFNVELKRNSSNLLFSKTCFTHSYWPFFATWRHTRDKVTLYKVIPRNVGLSWGLSWGLSRGLCFSVFKLARAVMILLVCCMSCRARRSVTIHRTHSHLIVGSCNLHPSPSCHRLSRRDAAQMSSTMQ